MLTQIHYLSAIPAIGAECEPGYHQEYEYQAPLDQTQQLSHDKRLKKVPEESHTGAAQVFEGGGHHGLPPLRAFHTMEPQRLPRYLELCGQLSVSLRSLPSSTRTLRTPCASFTGAIVRGRETRWARRGPLRYQQSQQARYLSARRLSWLFTVAAPSETEAESPPSNSVRCALR